MITKTFQNCYFTDLWVSPIGWKKSKKDLLKKQWYVQCYFHDPQYREKYPRGFPFRKKINKLGTLKERIEAVNFLLEEIPRLLKLGYNPITKHYMHNDLFENKHCQVDEDTPFLQALNWAFANISVAKTTQSDIKYILKAFSISVQSLRLENKPIKNIRKRDIRFVIDDIQEKNGAFSNHKFNKYRDCLSILFKEMCEYDLVETNIIHGISKKKTIKHIRDVLSDEERILVHDHLKSHFYRFWLFTLIFFHSGARISELLDLRIKDVNLSKGIFRILLKKGKDYLYIDKVMKDISITFWEQAITGGKPDDYVFSIGLRPGQKRIRREQIQRRWRIHVKQKLGITADFYALKHLNLDDISRMYSINEAANSAGHTSTRMVATHYAVGEKERQNEKLRKISNRFA